MATNRDIYKRGRLTARPNPQSVKENPAVGLQALHLAERRDGYVYVPENYEPGQPASLALMLHGAGGEATHGLSLIRKYANEHNIIIIAPASRAHSWDIIANESFDQDMIFIDQALALVFEEYAVNPAQIAIGGFSDGASYALCVGLSNGDLFSHILAFSPGFQFTLERQGKPAVFVSHGVKDRVLPLDPCSRRIVPQLQHQGYQVNYKEFEGAHEVPPEISKSGVEWFTRRMEK